MTADVRISRLAAPITVLGPGTRVALWVQGCTIGCHGCASTDTWDAAAGTAWAVPALADEIVRLAARTGATGLSVTGGEPFQQAAALPELIAAVRRRWPADEPADVLVFTGYAAAAAQRRGSELWDAADIVIAGPYRRDRPSDHPLLGSANQTIHAPTALGQERLATISSARARLQVSVADGQLSLVGMPDPGDLTRLRALLAERGVLLRDVSWQEEALR